MDMTVNPDDCLNCAGSSVGFSIQQEVLLIAYHNFVITPVANTRAFGGVATGSMKANEAEAVAGSIRYNGLVLMSSAQTFVE